MLNSLMDSFKNFISVERKEGGVSNVLIKEIYFIPGPTLKFQFFIPHPAISTWGGVPAKTNSKFENDGTKKIYINFSKH